MILFVSRNTGSMNVKNMNSNLYSVTKHVSSDAVTLMIV